MREELLIVLTSNKGKRPAGRTNVKAVSGKEDFKTYGRIQIAIRH